MIAVVDYRKGNLMSVERGLEAAGARAVVTDDADAIARAEAIVLPGVGAFADAARTMIELGQMNAIRRRIAEGTPFLGICLGMHLLFEEGVEGAPDEDDEESSHNATGLAVLPGVVTRMPKAAADGKLYKVPHVGWNTVVPPACRPAEQPDAAAAPGTGSCPSAAAGRTEVQPGLASGQSSAPDDRLADVANEMGSSKSCIQPASPEGASGPLPADGGGATLRTPSSPSHDCGSGAHEAEGRAAQRGVAQPSSAGVADAAARFSCPLFEGIDPGTYFYFTHSYIAPDGPFVVGQTTHSVTFPSAVQYGDACFGVQFHPEKSSDAGAALLRNFVRIVKEGGR